ncbi:MAG: hypothetical protein AAGA03_14630 [Planctomycetota bacterium]
MDLYNGYGFRITPSGGSATLIGGITQQTLMTETTQNAVATAGSAFAHHGEITQVSPRAQFTSLQVGAVLDVLGLTGACLAGGALPGLEMWQLKKTPCGDIASGSVHRKMTIPNGLVVPRSLSVSHREDATIQAETIATFDGNNDPLIISPNEAAPAGLADLHRYTLGPMTVGGHAIAGNLSLNIDFGNSAAGDSGDSDPFDTHIEVAEIIPRITIQTRDVSKFAASLVPLRGLLGEHADTSFILRRRVNGTADYSDAADNIRITARVMANFDQIFSAQNYRRGEASLQMTALHDGTNAPLIIETDYDPTP